MVFRSMLYSMVRLRGDTNVVKKGKVKKRVVRRTTGKITGRAMGKMF